MYAVRHAKSGRSYFNCYENRAAALIEFFNVDYWNCRSALSVVNHSDSVPEHLFKNDGDDFTGYAIFIYSEGFTYFTEVSSKLGLLPYVVNPNYLGCRMHIAPLFANKALDSEFFCAG